MKRLIEISVLAFILAFAGCGKSPLSVEADKEELTVSVTATDTVEVGQEATIKWRSENAERVEVTFVQHPDLNGEEKITFNSPGKRTITATAYGRNESVSDSASVVVKEDDDVIYISSDLTVTTEEGDQVIHEAASFSIEKRGYYRVKTIVEYDGDDERNESFFLQAKDPSGDVRGPRNPNLVDLYKIIEDDGNPDLHESKRHSGIFRMLPGENHLELHHYSEISEHHQEYKNGDFEGLESVRVLGFELHYVGGE